MLCCFHGFGRKPINPTIMTNDKFRDAVAHNVFLNSSV